MTSGGKTSTAAADWSGVLSNLSAMTVDQIISELAIDWTAPTARSWCQFSDINDNHENSGRRPVVEPDLKGSVWL